MGARAHLVAARIFVMCKIQSLGQLNPTSRSFLGGSLWVRKLLRFGSVDAWVFRSGCLCGAVLTSNVLCCPCPWYLAQCARPYQWNQHPVC